MYLTWPVFTITGPYSSSTSSRNLVSPWCSDLQVNSRTQVLKYFNSHHFKQLEMVNGLHFYSSFPIFATPQSALTHTSQHSPIHTEAGAFKLLTSTHMHTPLWSHAIESNLGLSIQPKDTLTFSSENDNLPPEPKPPHSLYFHIYYSGLSPFRWCWCAAFNTVQPFHP